jgi:hypothetical protein
MSLRASTTRRRFSSVLAVFASVAVVGCFGQWREDARESVLRTLGPSNVVFIDDSVHSYGLESWGARQVTGNGCLAATKDMILFRQWAPARSFFIRRSAITSVYASTRRAGKSTVSPVLHVSFTNDTGNPDSLTWSVENLAAWLALLRGQL